MEREAFTLPASLTAKLPTEPIRPPGRDLLVDSWLSVAIEEYKSIRTESLDSMKIQNTILSYGVTTIGLILTAGIGMIEKNMTVLDEAIFCFFIPLIIYFIVIIWAGEVARMYRAGSFLARREKVISHHVDKLNMGNSSDQSALIWENWLLDRGNNKETPHQRLYTQHYSILGMFLFLALLSIMIGNYKLADHNSAICLVMVDIIEVFVLVYLAYRALFLLRHYHSPIAPWLDRLRRRATTRRDCISVCREM